MPTNFYFNYLELSKYRFQFEKQKIEKVIIQQKNQVHSHLNNDKFIFKVPSKTRAADNWSNFKSYCKITFLSIIIFGDCKYLRICVLGINFGFGKKKTLSWRPKIHYKNCCHSHYSDALSKKWLFFKKKKTNFVLWFRQFDNIWICRLTVQCQLRENIVLLEFFVFFPICCKKFIWFLKQAFVRNVHNNNWLILIRF